MKLYPKPIWKELPQRISTAEEKEILSLLCKVHELEIDKVKLKVQKAFLLLIPGWNEKWSSSEGTRSKKKRFVNSKVWQTKVIVWWNNSQTTETYWR